MSECLPKWLVEEEYKPIKDKDTFIDKSIMSLIKILSKFQRQTSYKKNKFAINDFIKVISAITIIILLSTSRSFLFVFTINAFLLLLISFLQLDEIKSIISAGFKVAIFTFIMLIPSILMGNVNNSILIVMKVVACIVIVNILSYKTEWNNITGTLRLFHVPDIFIFVLDTTIKYIMILGQLSLDMFYAIKLRSVGKSKQKRDSLSGVIGTIFIKSKEMSEDMYNAMECRGFNGTYKTYGEIKLNILDYSFILINILIIFIYFYFARL